MERVETLIKKITDLYNSNASAQELLLAVQMLQAELLSLHTGNSSNFGNVTITLNENILPKKINYEEEKIVVPKLDDVKEEKIIEVLQVDEEAIEKELEEIKRNAETIQAISTVNKPTLVFDDVEVKQEKDNKEINDIIAPTVASVNDKLKQTKIDLGDSFNEVPIRDLRKAIDINARFLFINELFRGDEAMYERCIKTINNFSILPEAEYWIQRELKTKMGWIDKSETVQQFDQLVKRRFL